ncbi:MAG TPA: cytochrome c3 family protein [Candidatus Polarisedimenticolia bacterium]|nr:cytochrome c3 family protein [Candidatus Polarisedimenticolia bacterium]
MIGLPLLLLATVVRPPARACGLCHPDVRVQFEQSVHRAEGIDCTSCHGGNAAAATVAAAHTGSFRGRPARRAIPGLCASCHADIARMRSYNLPVDQYALYQTSQHGLRLARGDERVAICTDCHGVHEIRRPDDPASGVFKRNIPKTCGRCHADAALMGRYGLKGNPYADYAGSVHGKALLEQGNATAPDCSRCHGAHGAAPPGVGDVDKVCGQCHAATRTFFLAGPHKAAMDAAGLPECASCHDHHRIEPAAAALLDTVCLKCHDATSPQLEIAATFRTLFSGASDEIDRARQIVDRAAEIPLYVEDYRARLEEAHTALLESYPAMHALETTRVEPFTQRARSIALEIQSEVNGKIEGRKWRRVGLLVFWFYLLLTVAILVRFRSRAVAGAPR